MSSYYGAFPAVKNGIVTREFFLDVIANIFTPASPGTTILGIDGTIHSSFEAGHGISNISTDTHYGACVVLPFSLPVSVTPDFYTNIIGDDNELLVELYDVLVLKDVNSTSVNIGFIPAKSRISYEGITIGDLVTEGSVASSVITALNIDTSANVIDVMYQLRIRNVTANTQSNQNETASVERDYVTFDHRLVAVRGITPSNPEPSADLRFCGFGEVITSPGEPTTVLGPRWVVDNTYLVQVRNAFWPISDITSYVQHGYSYDQFFTYETSMADYVTLLNTSPDPYEEIIERLDRLEKVVYGSSYIAL